MRGKERKKYKTEQGVGKNDSNVVCSSCERKTNKIFAQRMAFVSFVYYKVMMNCRLSNESQQLPIAAMAESL